MTSSSTVSLSQFRLTMTLFSHSSSFASHHMIPIKHYMRPHLSFASRKRQYHAAMGFFRNCRKGGCDDVVHTRCCIQGGEMRIRRHFGTASFQNKISSPTRRHPCHYFLQNSTPAMVAFRYLTPSLIRRNYAYVNFSQKALDSQIEQETFESLLMKRREQGQEDYLSNDESTHKSLVLSLDINSHATGFCIMDYDTKEILDCGALENSQEHDTRAYGKMIRQFTEDLKRKWKVWPPISDSAPGKHSAPEQHDEDEDFYSDDEELDSTELTPQKTSNHPEASDNSSQPVRWQIYVESFLQKYRRMGKNDVIHRLVAFNCAAAYEASIVLDSEPLLFSYATAKSFFRFGRASSNKVMKRRIFNYFKPLLPDNFETILTDKKQIFASANFDITDSVLIALYGRAMVRLSNRLHDDDLFQSFLSTEYFAGPRHKARISGLRRSFEFDKSMPLSDMLERDDVQDYLRVKYEIHLKGLIREEFLEEMGLEPVDFR